MTIRTAIFACVVSVLLQAAEAGKFNAKLSPGDPAPKWADLKGIDGKSHALADSKSKLLVVVFTCNQCPVASGYQPRIRQLVADFTRDDVAFVAINANTGKGETLEKMSQRAAKSGFGFDYLKDETQSVAKAYGVRTTPTFFLLDADRKVVYYGALDDNAKSANAVEHCYLRDALTAALKDQQPEVAETRSTGCVITYADEE